MYVRNRTCDYWQIISAHSNIGVNFFIFSYQEWLDVSNKHGFGFMIILLVSCIFLLFCFKGSTHWEGKDLKTGEREEEKSHPFIRNSRDITSILCFCSSPLMYVLYDAVYCHGTDNIQSSVFLLSWKRHQTNVSIHA